MLALNKSELIGKGNKTDNCYTQFKMSLIANVQFYPVKMKSQIKKQLLLQHG
jgi:hypothetical protein